MRRSLALVVAVGLLAACAPAREAAPPVPELVGAQPVPADPVAARARPAATRSASGEAVADGAPADGSLADGSLADDILVDGAPADDTVAGDIAADETAADPAGLSAASDEIGGWAAFEASLDRAILAGGSTAYSAAVVVDGELVRSSASGERAAGSGSPVDGDTRFRVASISKVVTAIVLLQLVDDGLVGLDEPIGTRLAESLGVTAPHPSVPALTIEHLLSHTTGVGAMRSSFFSGRGLICAEIGAQVVQGRVAPGAGMQYSNANTCLAHLLVEALTGQDYTDVVYQRLLTPLGITGMRLAGTYDAGPGEAEHWSRPGRNYMEALVGAGAWIASAADIALIVGSLDPASPGWRPLSDELLQRMRQPPLGRSAGGYGLGLILYPDGSVGHTGTLESTHAMVVSRPDGVTWAVLVNGEHPRQSAGLRPILDRALAAGFPT